MCLNWTDRLLFSDNVHNFLKNFMFLSYPTTGQFLHFHLYRSLDSLHGRVFTSICGFSEEQFIVFLRNALIHAVISTRESYFNMAGSSLERANIIKRSVDY